LSLLFDGGSVEYFDWDVIESKMDILINQKLEETGVTGIWLGPGTLHGRLHRRPQRGSLLIPGILSIIFLSLPLGDPMPVVFRVQGYKFFL
jgi:hypothetical protein